MLHEFFDEPDNPKDVLQRAIASKDWNAVRRILDEHEELIPILHYAVSTGELEFVRLLVTEFHADVTAELELSYKYSPPGETALHIAAQRGFVRMAQFLVEQGAEVNASENRWRNTPLHCACRLSESGAANEETLKYLLSVGGVEINARDRVGETPLHHACGSGNVKAVEILLCHKADVEARAMHGVTPLLVTVQIRNEKLAKLLIKSGANVNMGRDDGWTPLHQAAINGHTRMAEILLDAGAEINPGTNSKACCPGETPLRVARDSAKNFKDCAPERIPGLASVAEFLESRGGVY